MNRYSVCYSSLSLQDLKDIFSYIAFELKEPAIAEKQSKRIRDSIKGLDTMPNRFPVVDFEPFASMNIRKISVDNYLVFYQVEESNNSVVIIRICYGGRDIENIIK